MNAAKFAKYGSVFSLSLQQELYYSASFLMDRARSITIIIAFYAFWSSIFQGRAEVLGYTKSQMFSYILGMNVLRALVFSEKTWDVIREINTGKISSYLIRPVSYIGYSLCRDAADKVSQFFSSILEVALALWISYLMLWLVRLRSTLRGRRVALLSALGFSLVLFTFLGVSRILHSGHPYL